jgi:predicted RNA-binding Zn ribbon-like protein
VDGDAAPGRLVLVQELVNSFDVRRGRDELGGPEEAATWLHARRLLDRPSDLTAKDVQRVHGLRELLRRMCLNNNGAQPRTSDIDILNALVHDADLRPVFTAEGVGLQAGGPGLNGALGQIIALVYDAIRDGSWRRLKACPEDACNYAFYDTSRNSSRVWCSMAGCGSKAKMRAYRARNRTQQ